ncbi:MAG TPA: ankyrin repeat domain-containing protein [Patescibacteria group bacterium]|nr:ankyrin repeat domain-containing protein [Patescibacteria group bacterium]
MKRTFALALTAWLACFQLPAAPSAANTSVFNAIRAGDLSAVRTALKNGADLQARDEQGDTLLMAAALSADAEMLETLINAGADVNAVSPAGVTPLLRAATFEDKTRLLLAHGADVKARSGLGNSALILAARKHGNSRTVQLLLDRGLDPNGTNALGATALMAAAAAADRDSVQLLLDRGADVNARPNMDGDGFIWGGGRSALMWAAFQGDEALVRLLLKRGARVNDFTVAGGALAQAAWGGHLGVARILLDAGAQVDQRDLAANYTPLHWAACAEHSSPALAELLIARGADVNAEGGQPVDNFLAVAQTPLMLAQKRGDTPIVRALLKAGAKSPKAAANAKANEHALAASGHRTVVQAIQLAMPPLARTAEESASTFVRHASNQECVSCHQQQLPLTAFSLAHSRHIPTDRAVTRRQVELLKREFSAERLKLGDNRHSILEMDLQTTFHPEPAIVDGYAAMDLRLEQEPASAQTDAMIHQLATIQNADGHWAFNLPRPPIQASDITATAQAVYTIQSYAIPARQRELSSCVRRARAWLAKAQPETNEERVHQLLGLASAGEKESALKKLAEELIRQQRADGGWAQLAGLGTDAYATGQSLYALMEAGRIPSSHPAVSRGIDFLLRTQFADGTWFVHTRTHPFQPPMESSFPHGKDGWISCAGTSWAVIALATSLDPTQVPKDIPMLAQVTATSSAVAPSAGDPAASHVEFARDIRPLLERSCLPCHSGERPKGGFLVTKRATVLRGGKRGEPAVVPGKPEASPMLRFVQDSVEDLEMPPLARREKFPPLTKEEVAKLSTWVAQGANWPEDTTLQAPGK